MGPAIDQVIGWIYGAVVDPGEWPRALRATTAFVGGFGASLELFDPRTQQPLGFESANLATEGVGDYLEYYWKVSPRTPRILSAPAGWIDWDYRYYTDREMDRDEFYADFLRVWDCRCYLSAKLLASEDLSAIFAIHRTIDQGHASPEEIARLRRIAPHLTRAVQINQRLLAARRHAAELRETLAMLSAGAWLLDAHGEVRYANDAAERLVTDGALRVDHARLRARSPRQDAAVQRLIGDTVTRGGAGGTLLLDQPAGARISLLIAPLPDSSETGGPLAALARGEAARAVVFASTEGHDTSVLRKLLEAGFRLTPAEIRLTESLLAGRTVQEHAEHDGVRVTTARTHAARVRAKLEVRSQTEAVRKILALLPPVDRRRES